MIMDPKAQSFVAAMLACPHQWGPEKSVTLVDGNKKRDGMIRTCVTCGVHRVVYPDRTAQYIEPDGLSDVGAS